MKTKNAHPLNGGSPPPAMCNVMREAGPISERLQNLRER